MSKYTTQLRWIVEQLGAGLPKPNGQQYADAVYKYIGLNEYPIFNESYRKTLNDMIINHYFFREIGFETAAQFAWYMKRTMQEIMPKYNMMYAALEQMANENPLTDYARHRKESWKEHEDNIGHIDMDSRSMQNDVTASSSSTTDVGRTTESSTDKTDGKTDNRNVFQDTPMGLLSNAGSPSIENMDYATNVTFNNEITSNTTTGNSTVNRSDSTTGKNDGRLDRTKNDNRTTDSDYDTDRNGERFYDEYGRNKSLAALVKEFEEDFINIDLMVIEDLEDLFFGLW